MTCSKTLMKTEMYTNNLYLYWGSKKTETVCFIAKKTNKG